MFNFSVPHVDLVAWLITGIAIAPTAHQVRLGIRPVVPATLVGFGLLVPLGLDVIADQRLAAGYEAERGGDTLAARGAYEDAVGWTPWQPQLQEVLARFGLRTGDAALALGAATRAQDLSGDDPRWSELHAEAQLAAGNADRAAEEFTNLIRTDRRNASLYEGLGHSLAATGDRDGARRAFNRALELNPRRSGAATGLAELGT